jgi:hypothetical protein
LILFDFFSYCIFIIFEFNKNTDHDLIFFIFKIIIFKKLKRYNFYNIFLLIFGFNREIKVNSFFFKYYFILSILEKAAAAAA